MERSDDDESATPKDHSSDNATDEDSEFVEVDPTGRYGRYAEVLGKGAYKTVYRAFDNLDGIEVAWNQVKLQDTLDKSGDVQRLYSELHLLKTLKHRNIMKFCNSWVDTHCRNVNFITEIFTSGTLRQYIKKHKNVKLKAIKHWARQILHGLVYLHNHNPPIIHRDLKCDNIFINGNSGEVKIGDLGLAAILSQAPAAHSVIGTPEFMAPELYEEHYNELVDIYSFGMCLLEMLTCEYPYSECTNAAQIYKKVTMGKKPAALDKVKDPKIYMFVETCLASASERLHARELLMDPFLRSGDDVEILEQVQPTVPSHYDDLKGLYPVFRQSCVESADISAQEQEKVHDNKEFELAEKVKVASSSDKIRGPNPSRSKVSLKRRGDFKLKARKQNDKKVLFRFRISSLGGEVRYIQFEFDLGMDTAISVAYEMITELELPVGDASVIADMIDAEFMSLIPDWKPGLSLQELADVQQELPLTNAHFHEKKADDVDGSDVTTGLGVEMDDSKNDILMHGRFEEMGCNLADFQLKQHEPDGTVCFSDFSSEQFEGGGSDLSLDASFDRLSVETRANDKSATQNLEDFGPDIKLEPSIALEKPSLSRSDGDSSEECFPFPAPDPKLEGDSDREEIKLLVLQQNQELQLLQSKHHQELLELKMRLNEHVKTALNELGLQEGASLQVESELGLPMAVMCREPEALSTTCDENALDREVISEAEELPVIELAGKDSELLVESSKQLPSVLVTQSVTTDEGPGNSDGVDTTFSQNGDIALHKSDCEVLSIGEAAEKAGYDVKQAPGAEGAEIGQLDEGECHMKSASMGASINVPAENTTHLAFDHTSKGVNMAEQHVKSASIGAVICEAPESQVDLPLRSPVMERASSFNKRESYLQLYKSGAGQTDKLLSSKVSEKSSTSDKASDAKKDNEIEQARKQQLQKSIAELEAKTLEGLSQSQNRYLAKVVGKSNAATQPGSSSSHGR